MSDEPVMTPISPEEGGSVPPKVAPFPAPAAVAPAAPGGSTIRLKPVIRKPMIHKPVIGGAPKPPASPAAPAAPSPDAAKKATANMKKATQSLGAVTGPMPAQAVLRKTGIIAEGIITPAQQQAAKSKTSRISLESAIGVAPAKESAAPLKTIRLRRPADLKHPAPSPLKPVAPAEPGAASESVSAPVPEDAVAAPAVAAETDASTTQKKTLKLHRPSGLGVKRPTLGIKKLGEEPPSANAGGTGGDGIAELPADMGEIPELKPIAPMEFAADASGGETSAGVPGWVAALSLVTTIAALAVLGVVVYFLYMEGCGPVAGANEMQFIQL